MEAATENAAELVVSVLVGLQKEAVRLLLLGCFTVLLRQFYVAAASLYVALAPARPAWLLRALRYARAAGAVALAAFAIAAGVSHFFYNCPDTAPLCIFSPPPPPPPPPPKAHALLALAARRAKQAGVFCREHPLEVAGGLGALVIADWLNVLVRIDRLDIVLRLAKLVTRPLRRLVESLLPLLSAVRAPA